MKKQLTILAVLIFALSSVAFGQLADQAMNQDVSQKYAVGLKPASSPFSLLDFSRINWSHSYSVSFFSGGSYSGSAGLWQSNMFYEISPKLSLALNLGVVHDISGNLNQDSRFLPGFHLDYHPSDNFRLSIGMQTYSGYDYNYRNYYYPYYGYREPFYERR